MPVPVLLRGAWVDPSGTPRTGRVLARRHDDARTGQAVWFGTSTRVLDDGILPESGPGALFVTAPDVGHWSYEVTEALDGDDPVTYEIAVSAADATSGVDLSLAGGP